MFTDDFIDTSLFDDDYLINENDLKPDFEELLEGSSRSLTESVHSVDSKGIQVDGSQEKKISKKSSSKRSTIKCTACDEEFTGPSKLAVHAKDVHNDTKPFKCTINNCTRSYQNTKALKVHKRSHDADKRFKCSECSASFHVKCKYHKYFNLNTNWQFSSQFQPTWRPTYESIRDRNSNVIFAKRHLVP